MIRIGENLKRLRNTRELTQEQLAEMLGVSPQAVSRWENGITYPDITLLPVISEFFGVTIDNLMGMTEIRDEKKVEELIDRINRNAADGLLYDNIVILREAVKNYPYDYRFQVELMQELSRCSEHSNGNPLSDDEISQNKQEAVSIGNKILRCRTDIITQAGVMKDLCWLYHSMGDNDKAIEIAEKLPDMWFSRDNLLDYFYTGEKQRRHCQFSITKCAECIHRAMLLLADLGYKNDKIDTAQRIAIIKKSIALYELIFEDGDYFEKSAKVSELYRYVAAMEMLNNNFDAALENLEKAAEYAVMSDTLPDNGRCSSLLVKDLEYDKVKMLVKNDTCSNCAELLDRMSGGRYDPIRNDKRFMAIIEKIKEHID